MAILNANIGLAANYCDDRGVEKADFIERVKGIDNPEVKEIACDRGVGLSSLIVFLEEELHSFEDRDDPDEAFDQAIIDGMNKIADWLKLQDSIIFDNFRQVGLKVWIFVELWIEDDQLALKLPPHLLSECGRLNISIDIVTND